MGFNIDTTRIAMPRGRVFFARKNLTTGVLDPYVHMGNCSKFDFSTIGDDIAEIMDFTAVVSTPATRIAKARKPEFDLQLMEANPKNLALVFMAAAPSEYTQSGGAITGESVGVARVGSLYKLANKGISGGTQITALTVKKSATAFTTGTEVILRDSVNGIFEIVTLHAGISDGDAITADYTCPAIVAGSGYQQVLGGGVPRIEGALLYLGSSSIGPVHSLEIYNCVIASSGTYPFIATDPGEFSLKVNVLSDSTHTELFKLTEIETS